MADSIVGFGHMNGVLMANKHLSRRLFVSDRPTL
ncbi:hypothetical protein CCACVL1_26663 [Corchorus capsularis]|uniref:Uncharacterized protein n=1 Tax=Corchorus capsularis TaxID=210143 RepID=A0A1R3GDU2_COCAP|nr:hypothetical protein CCACVL1_26663 [Corchorus capsularis]